MTGLRFSWSADEAEHANVIKCSRIFTTHALREFADGVGGAEEPQGLKRVPLAANISITGLAERELYD
jgi:hypothetical protein